MPQGRPQALHIGLGIHSDFPLGHHAQVVAVQEFQGIFQGDDMAFLGFVDPIHQAGQGSGFAAARRTYHQHHALAVVPQFHHRIGDVQLAVVRQLEPDHPDHGGQTAPLTERTDPEPGQPRNGKGKVIVPGAKQGLHIPVSCQVVNFLYQLPGIPGKQTGAAPLADLTVAPQRGAQSGYNINIGSVLFHRFPQQLFHTQMSYLLTPPASR